LWAILTPYRWLILILALLTIGANGLTLWLPKVISHAIDAYAHHTLILNDVIWLFSAVSLSIFVLTYIQNLVQTYTSELVAKDLREKLAGKISRQSYAYIEQENPSKLLTNLTSDIDAVKLFVSQAIVSMISSVALILGASTLLLLTNWHLALAVLTIVPIIGIAFFTTLARVRKLFLQSREIIDRLNRVITESIVGAALIRVLNSIRREDKKFDGANRASRDLGLRIVTIFATLIPIITFVASLGSVIILGYGGHLIIQGSFSLGDFAAFSTYVSILIFPIIMLGFISNVVAQAQASYGRIAHVLGAQEPAERGTLTSALTGAIVVDQVTVSYGEKAALDSISFTIKPGTKTAILGPTAAGKTQLLYALTGLIQPTTGTVLFDGHAITDYQAEALHRQLGFVFQDSIMFNMTVRENIAFSPDVTDASLKKAIETAELSDLIRSLPQGLNTVVSERGTSLSGGQKQRIMLARALAFNPSILLLDDFTARVDAATEEKILGNLQKNYPNLTLISVTQKVASVQHYDQIILLMEGEKLADGTHKQLLKSSTDYMELVSSQASTSTYELHA